MDTIMKIVALGDSIIKGVLFSKDNTQKIHPPNI